MCLHEHLAYKVRSNGITTGLCNFLLSKKKKKVYTCHTLQWSQLDRPRGLEATHKAESFMETHLLESGVLFNPYTHILFPS